MSSVDPSRHDRFFLSQRIRRVVNQYEVSTLGPDEKSAGEPVCFVEQKRMKLKEDLRAFTDDSKSSEVFRIKAQQVFDPRARYDVTAGFADWLPIPYHLDYFMGDRRIGGLERILGVRDRYRLDVSGDAQRTIDRRVVLALAVGMDALQAR
jgi:hypothetical protein